MGESKYKGQITRCEVESMVAPLRDKEPTPAWYRDFKEVLAHYDVPSALLSRLAVERGGSNTLGHKYSKYTLKNMINNFIRRNGSMTWTKNAQAVINDHLDILVDYLSRNDDLKPGCYEPVTDTPEPEEKPILTLKERLEKERAGGKWPSVDERIKEKTNAVSKLFTNKDINVQDLIKAVDETGETNKARVKRVRKNKKHKKCKTNNIYITIKIGR